MPVMIAASPVELGEHVAQDPQRAARRDLRDQIARLERELALTLAGCFPRSEPARGGKSASTQAGPRLLGLEHAAPRRHCWATVMSGDLGEPGCSVWQVRPRFGVIGMLTGWWRVKLSSGCPLATGNPRPVVAAGGSR